MPPKAGHIKKTPQERKAADLAYRKAKNAAMTPEEKEEFKKKNRKTQEAIRDNRTPEQTDLDNKKARDKRKEQKDNDLKMADRGAGGGITEEKEGRLIKPNLKKISYISNVKATYDKYLKLLNNYFSKRQINNSANEQFDQYQKIFNYHINKQANKDPLNLQNNTNYRKILLDVDREFNEANETNEYELPQTIPLYEDYKVSEPLFSSPFKTELEYKQINDQLQDHLNELNEQNKPDYDYNLGYGGGYSENLPNFETKNDYKVDNYDYILNSPNAPSAPNDPNAPNISLSEEAYNVMKNTKKIIKETKMLTGKNKATLFNGEDLDDESKHDDDEDMATGATQSGYERNQNARANTDIPDMSDFNFERYAEAGADELPIESQGRRRKPIREESDFRRSNRRRSQGIYSQNDPLDDEGAYSNNYAGSNAALQINGYGRPAMPQFNNPNRTREINPNQSMDGLDQQNPEPEEDQIQNEISNLMNLNMGDNDSIDNPLNMESLLKRMKSANRGDSSMRGFREKNKWNPTMGRGNKLKGIKTMSNSLSSIRESQIPYKQPNRSYKGDAVNLIKKGNSTITKIINQYQP